MLASNATESGASRLPLGRLRLWTLLWLAAYLPSYGWTYGHWHFLFLCNIGILLTAGGLIFGNALLLSSQAVAAPGVALLWLADAATRLVSGHFLHGGTAYMWDAQLPAMVRILSLYHLLWPLLLFACLRRCGYHREGLLLQVAIAAGAMLVGLTLAPASENLNYVIHAPGNPVPHAHPWLHAALMLGVLMALIYWPTHRACLRLFKPTRTTAAQQPGHPGPPLISVSDF
jgi:hypothetical protein